MVAPVKVPTHKFKDKETKFDRDEVIEFVGSVTGFFVGLIAGILLSILFVVVH